MVITGAVRHTRLQSNRHHQQTNTQLLEGCMPFLSPNQQCHGTEEKSLTYSTDLLILSSPEGLPTLPLTTKVSWLPWGRVAKHRQPSDASTPNDFYTTRLSLSFNFSEAVKRSDIINIVDLYYSALTRPLKYKNTHVCWLIMLRYLGIEC